MERTIWPYPVTTSYQEEAVSTISDKLQFLFYFRYHSYRHCLPLQLAERELDWDGGFVLSGVIIILEGH